MRELWFQGKCYDANNKLPVSLLVKPHEMISPFDLFGLAAICCKGVLALRIEHADAIKAYRNPRHPYAIAMRLRGQEITKRGSCIQHPRYTELRGALLSPIATSGLVEAFERLFGEWVDLKK